MEVSLIENTVTFRKERIKLTKIANNTKKVERKGGNL